MLSPGHKPTTKPYVYTWRKPVLSPSTDRSIVFARWRKCASNLIHWTHKRLPANPASRSSVVKLVNNPKMPIQTNNYYTLVILHPFNCLLSTTTWVIRYQKSKISLDLNEARDDGVLGCSDISWTICKQPVPCTRQITTTPHQIMNHTVGTCPLTKFEGGLNLRSRQRTMTQSYGWNLQRLQHSRNNK